MWKALAKVRFNKTQRDTMAKAAENVGTLLTGAAFVQGLFGVNHIDAKSAVVGAVMAVGCFAAALWLRRNET